MRQFSICTLRRAQAHGRDQLVLVLQHDILSDLRTRLVAPLRLSGEVRPVERLMPRVTFEGRDDLVGMDQMATVKLESLSSPRGEADARDAVMRAVDLLFTGF